MWDSLVGPTLQETPLVPFSSTIALSWPTQLLGDPDAKTIEGLQGHLGATPKHVGPQFFSPPQKMQKTKSIGHVTWGYMGALRCAKCVFFGLVEGTFQR